MSTVEQPRKLFEEFLPGDYIIEASETHSFSLPMDDVYIFDMMHIAKRQYFTPRVTVTRTARGLPFKWSNIAPHWVSLLKIPYTFVITNNANLIGLYPKHYYVFLVEGDTVYLNVQNMENSKNAYRIIFK